MPWLTPDEMRGRVAGASRLLAWGPQPLGALAGGLLATWFGLRAPFLVGGLAFLVMLALTRQATSNRSLAAARAAA